MSLKIEQLRQIDLPLVLAELGCASKDARHGKWRSPAGDLVTVEGSQIYNHDTEKGGGGAIDAIMLVAGWSFPASVAWLRKLAKASGEHLVFADVAEQQSIRKAFVAPVPSPERWKDVREYLLRRGLNGKLLDDLHQSGDVYAEELVQETEDIDEYTSQKWGERVFHKRIRVNAIFARRNLAGLVVGAAQRGIRFDFKCNLGPKEDGAFAVGDRSDPDRIAIVESPIDAISYYQCHAHPGLLVISTDGAGRPYMPLIEKYPDAAIVLAQDADEIGDQMAESIGKSLSSKGRRCEREKPPCGKDWSDFIQDIPLIQQHFSGENHE